MKISDSSQLTNAAELGRTRHSEALAGYGIAGGTGHSNIAGDQVELSGLGGKLAGILQSNSPERAARVEQLSRLYAAGRYQPAVAATSHAMVEEAVAAGPEIQ